MRGSDDQNGSLFSYVNLEERIPARHPLRKIRDVVNAALVTLDGDFDRLYADEGRPSIAPERLLRASLIQILFSVRSERQLMEQLQYNLLFRWFVGLGIDDPVWVPTVFSKNRDRLLNTDIARKFLGACVDGSVLARTFFTSQAWSEQPCVRPIDAVHMTAGHNALRGSGPGQKPALDSAVALVGCPDLRIDRICITCCSSFQPSHHAG